VKPRLLVDGVHFDTYDLSMPGQHTQAVTDPFRMKITIPGGSSKPIVFLTAGQHTVELEGIAGAKWIIDISGTNIKQPISEWSDKAIVDEFMDALHTADANKDGIITDDEYNTVKVLLNSGQLNRREWDAIETAWDRGIAFKPEVTSATMPVVPPLQYIPPAPASLVTYNNAFPNIGIFPETGVVKGMIATVHMQINAIPNVKIDGTPFIGHRVNDPAEAPRSGNQLFGAYTRHWNSNSADLYTEIPYNGTPIHVDYIVGVLGSGGIIEHEAMRIRITGNGYGISRRATRANQLMAGEMPELNVPFTVKPSVPSEQFLVEPDPVTDPMFEIPLPTTEPFVVTEPILTDPLPKKTNIFEDWQNAIQTIKDNKGKIATAIGILITAGIFAKAVQSKKIVIPPIKSIGKYGGMK